MIAPAGDQPRRGCPGSGPGTPPPSPSPTCPASTRRSGRRRPAPSRRARARRAVRRVEDGVALAAQELAEHGAHARLVVDHQDARGARRARGRGAGGVGSGSRAGSPGSRTVKVLPSPGRLATSTVPPCRVTMPQTTASPSPLPCGPFVVKKGSKTRRAVSGGMPTPVSRTVTTAPVAFRASSKTRRPPRGMASSALMRRLVKTSRSSSGAPGHPGDGAGLDVHLVGDAAALRLVLPARPGHLDDFAHDVEELDPPERPRPARPRELLDAPHRLGAVERRLVDRLEAPRRAPAPARGAAAARRARR